MLEHILVPLGLIAAFLTALVRLRYEVTYAQHKQMRRQIKENQDQIAGLLKRVDECERERAMLLKENTELRRLNDAQAAEIDSLKAQNAEQAGQISTLQTTVAKLKKFIEQATGESVE